MNLPISLTAHKQVRDGVELCLQEYYGIYTYK